MKTLVNSLVAASIACLFSCSEDLEKTSSGFSAVVSGKSWVSEEVVAEAKTVDEVSRVIILRATHEDNSKIELSFELLGITPNNLSASFRKKGAVISSFSGSVTQNIATIKWTTSSEENVQYFDVMRSYDNSWYDYVGSVGGNGTTNTSHNYTVSIPVSEFYDVAYFKIRVADNFSYQYSEVLPLKIKVGVSFTDAVGQKLEGYDGSVIVSDYDLENRVVSGTFNFKYKAANGAEKIVTDGVFRNVVF